MLISSLVWIGVSWHRRLSSLQVRPLVLFMGRTGQLLAAIALAILGTALIATHGDITSLSLTPAGLSWGLVAAVGYALYTVLPADLLQRHNATLVTGLGLLLGGASLFLANQT